MVSKERAPGCHICQRLQTKLPPQNPFSSYSFLWEALRKGMSEVINSPLPTIFLLFVGAHIVSAILPGQSRMVLLTYGQLKMVLIGQDGFFHKSPRCQSRLLPPPEFILTMIRPSPEPSLSATALLTSFTEAATGTRMVV